MLAARYPQVKFGWTMRVGDHLVRTDAHRVFHAP